MTWRRWLALGAALVGVALAGVGALALDAWRTIHRPYLAAPGGEVRLVVEPGMDARSILDLLEREGVVADARLARLFLVHVLEDPPLLAGEYRFSRPATVPAVLERLMTGEVVTYRVTLIEGLTLAETAEHLAEAGFGELERFLAVMSDPTPIADLDPGAPDLEGYLFPDTYEFPRGTPERAIVDQLVATFRDRAAGLLSSVTAEGERPATGAPEAVGSVHDLVTLASIVEKECRLDAERPIVAGVYAHRLRIGMGLYADPTVIFALKKLGRWDGNLRRPDLKLDSPYNTYVQPGLPPGPICSPGLASLEAAAAPADVPYLYFVSRNDGSHLFARTLAEHNRNVAKWQKQYWRERWAQERRRSAEGTADDATEAGDGGGS